MKQKKKLLVKIISYFIFTNCVQISERLDEKKNWKFSSGPRKPCWVKPLNASKNSTPAFPACVRLQHACRIHGRNKSSI